MSWATHYITQLQSGSSASFRPRGHSMRPHIRSGQLVTVVPLKEDEMPSPRDIVLCRVRGADYLHFVSAVRDRQALIANAHGHENGWTSREKIYGRLTSVED